MRCDICGRVVDESEPMYAKETIGCQGCHAEIEAGATKEEARANHEAREINATHDEMKARNERIAAGKNGDGDGSNLRDFAFPDGRIITVAAQRAHAVKVLAQIERQRQSQLEATRA